MDPDPTPDPAPAAGEAPDEASTTIAALSLRDLPPDFAAGPPPEIDAAADADEDEDDDEGYATAASRGGSSTAAWKEEMEGLEEDGYGDAGPPSPSSSGYAGERGSSLASSGGIQEEEEPDASTPPHAPGAEDWARGKKHADERAGRQWRWNLCRMDSKTSPSRWTRHKPPSGRCRRRRHSARTISVAAAH